MQKNVHEQIALHYISGNCTNPYGKTKFFMEEIMKDVVTANPDWGCQLLRLVYYSQDILRTLGKW